MASEGREVRKGRRSMMQLPASCAAVLSEECCIAFTPLSENHSVGSDSLRPHHSLPAPLSMKFARQGYWSGLPFPSPGDLPDPGIEPRSPALQADSLSSEPP